MPIPFASFKNIKNPSFLPLNKKLEDLILINIFYNYLQIELNLFKNLILDDLLLYILVKNKEKSVFKKKNITKLI